WTMSASRITSAISRQARGREKPGTWRTSQPCGSARGTRLPRLELCIRLQKIFTWWPRFTSSLANMADRIVNGWYSRSYGMSIKPRGGCPRRAPSIVMASGTRLLARHGPDGVLHGAARVAECQLCGSQRIVQYSTNEPASASTFMAPPRVVGVGEVLL